MELALDVIGRSLRGEVEARSFLERTSSIYVLDVSDAANPKTYGCWNFIHQALNEVERCEARSLQSGMVTGNMGSETLVAHVRLLASMALRAARRSPASESVVVSNCIANAAEYQCSATQKQWLIDLNLELREIVMARVAAMALDFSFHRRVGHCAHSAFADKVVLDSFCAVLSANAVSTGPQGIRHFATEWIIPSSKNIPLPALVAVVKHLGQEGQRLSAPVGVRDALQLLSKPIMSVCVVPILSDAVSDNASQTDVTLSLHDENANIAVTALQALKAWADATDLSLPQLRHICSKVNLDVLEILSNAMYSDSRDVIEALAEFVECSCQGAGREAISQARMNQVRHIIEVDESFFQANFTSDQLEAIETKEMGTIAEELAFAIGLQRLRFVARQQQGDHDVCRNLARIAATVATSYVKTTVGGPPQHTERGLVDLLSKAAAHPHVHIASIAVHVLPLLLSPTNSIVKEALPILQRRAIIPHEVTDGKIEIQTDSFSDVSLDDFLDFREHVLSDALIACYNADGEDFFDSCTSAVEEFCSEGASIEVSLFLEAAIFCIEAVGNTVMSSHHPFGQTDQLKRCTQALASRRDSLTLNPLTLSRMADMLEKYAVWYREAEGLHTAAHLASLVFEKSSDICGFPAIDADQCSINPLISSCRAIKAVVSVSPRFFAEDSKLSALADLWKICHITGSHQAALDADARRQLGSGICHVLSPLSDDIRLQSFENLLSFPQNELERLVQLADSTVEEGDKTKYLEKVSREIGLIASLCWCFTNSGTIDDTFMESGCPSSPENRELVTPPVLSIVRRSWPKIAQVASTYVSDTNVAKSLCTFLTDLLPPTVRDDYSLGLLRDLCAIASSMLSSGTVSCGVFESLCEFLDQLVLAHGHAIDRGAETIQKASTGFAAEREIFRLTEGLFLSGIEYARPFLGEFWTKPAEQGQGQPPFENHDEVVTKLSESTKECLTALLPLIQVCLDHSPIFLLCLPARPGVDREQDLLLRRVVDSTVSSLNEADGALSSCAILLLETMVKQNSSRNDEIRNLISEELARVNAAVLKLLIQGCCGNYESNIVDRVARYLQTLLRTSPSSAVESDMARALQQDCFVLGEEAMHVCMNVFAQCARHSLSQIELGAFLHRIWEIHRSEDSNALPQSDAVADLIRSYS